MKRNKRKKRRWCPVKQKFCNTRSCAFNKDEKGEYILK
jgi:hypothetical protein